MTPTTTTPTTTSAVTTMTIPMLERRRDELLRLLKYSSNPELSYELEAVVQQLANLASDPLASDYY
jgi:hypothetical protein